MTDLAAQVERARQCWNSGDLDGYLALYDDSSKLHGYSPESMRKPEVRAFYEQVCASLAEPGHSNPILEFHEIMTSGYLYCCRFTMRGVHRGQFLGVPATGRPYSIGGITMMRLSGGRVIERWSSADMLRLRAQVGAIPAPPS